MEKESLITPEVKAMIGTEKIFSSPEEVGKATIRRFAIAVGDPNPLYWDEEFAKKAPYGGIVAPPTMVFELIHNLGDEVKEEDGGYSDKILLPPPLTRFVRGGMNMSFSNPFGPWIRLPSNVRFLRFMRKEGRLARWFS